MSAPLFFNQFGKAVNDLFDADKFNTKGHSVALRNTTQLNGLLTGLSLQHESSLIGGKAATNATAKYKDASLGSFEATGCSDECLCAEAEFNQLGVKGLVIKAEGSQLLDRAQREGEASIEYTHEKIATVGVNYDFKQNSVTVEAAGNANGASVGVSVSAGAAGVSAVDAGLQYSQGDVTTTIASENNHSDVAISALYQYNKHITFALQAKHALAKEITTASVVAGGKVQCGTALSFAGTVDLQGQVKARMEHQLFPWAKLTIVGGSSVLAYTKPVFAVGLKLGETNDDE